MALDTAAKRLSIIGFGVPSYVFMPDGAVDDGDRLDVLGLYQGFAAGDPPDVGPGARRGGGFLRALGRLMNR